MHVFGDVVMLTLQPQIALPFTDCWCNEILNFSSFAEEKSMKVRRRIQKGEFKLIFFFLSRNIQRILV